MQSCLDGNPLDSHYFMALFHEVVEKRIDDPRGRLERLLKCTSANAKEMIKHCTRTTNYGLSTCQEDTSGKIWKSIPCYGRIQKGDKAWPIMRSGDTGGYQRFYNFLQKCESITQSAQWNQLDTPDVICMLLAKLPGHTRDK